MSRLTPARAVAVVSQSARTRAVVALLVAIGPVLALALGVAGAADPALADPPTVAASPAPTADSPSGGSYTIDVWTVDGGGSTSSGGAYEIGGTIGQPDADPLQPTSGGAYELTGGFWPSLAPAGPRPDAVFANGFE